MRENVIYFTGKDFLDVCKVEYITQAEYDTFTNILPNYFGERIFNFLFEDFLKCFVIFKREKVYLSDYSKEKK